jgi:hypothetical protein
VATTCNVNDLLADAACFGCLPSGFYLGLKIVLLEQILEGLGGEVPSNQTLFERGACFSCLSDGEIKILRLQLLCNINSSLNS